MAADPTLDAVEQRRRAARKTALILGLVAVSVFVAFVFKAISL